MAPQGVDLALRAASTPKPNPKDNHAPQILAVTCTLTAIAVCVNLLRFYVRTTILKHMGVDDWVMLAATVRCISRMT